MRPTTSTTTNKKSSGKSQILKTPFVSFPFQRSKFNSTIFVARLLVVLPTQDIILNEIASGESNVILRSLFWRKLRCKFVIEKEKNWLIVILHHGYGWSRIYVKLWQVGPYSYLRNYERKGGGSSYRKRKTNLRDASYEITKRPATDRSRTLQIQRRVSKS